MFETLIRPIPLPTNHVVASVAIGAESCRAVVGSRRCLVIGPMAAVAIGAHHVVPLFGTRYMASVAIGFGMHSDKWKAHLTMDVLYFAVLDQPRFGCMTAGTIVSNRLLVHILVALVAVRGSFVKDERRVALLAFNHFVLSHQREFRFIVVKVLRLHIVPCFRRMTIAALQLEVLAMRRLHGKAAKVHKKGHHQKRDSIHPLFNSL